MKNLKRIICVLLSMVFVFVLAACGGGSGSGTTATGEKEYIADTEIAQMFTNPDNFKGKYVKLIGKVFGSVEQTEDKVAFQAWYDVKNIDKSYVVYTAAGETYNEDDYVIVDGMIDGTLKGENAFGGDVSCPKIVNATVTKSNYIDVVAPALKTIEPNIYQEQNGFGFNVGKVEYAENETRIYCTAGNTTADPMSFGRYDIKLIVDGQQISQDDMSDSIYEGKLQEMDYEVAPGAATSGVLIFPAIDQNKNFQLIVPNIYSDNYDLDYDYTDMTFDITVA